MRGENAGGKLIIAEMKMEKQIQEQNSDYGCKVFRRELLTIFNVVLNPSVYYLKPIYINDAFKMLNETLTINCTSKCYFLLSIFLHSSSLMKDDKYQRYLDLIRCLLNSAQHHILCLEKIECKIVMYINEYKKENTYLLINKH